MSAPLRLQTQVWNPLGARSALVLHGAGSDGGCWWRLASHLADDGWLVVAPDLRSHGRSATAVDHRIDTLAGDVALLGGGYELLVGHSLGGAVAARLLTESGFARAAVLVDPALRLDPAARGPLRRRLTAAVGDIDAARLRRRHPDWDERDLQRQALAGRTVTPDVIDAVFVDNDPWDVLGDAHGWSDRVHLLAADTQLGGALPAELVQGLADGRQVTGEVVRGAGHWLHCDRPRRVVDAVERVTG